MGDTDNGAGLEKADQYLNFGFVKCEFSLRQIIKIKIKTKVVSDGEMWHKEKKVAVK